MMMQKFRRRFHRNEKGSVSTLVAITLPALIGFSVLAIDVGHYYFIRTSLQQAVDIGGLSILTKMRNESRVDQLKVSVMTAKYRDDAIALAKKNLPAAANGDAVRQYDVLFGKWDFKRKRFLPRGDKFPTNAVKISAQMSASRSNPVSTLFGKMFKNHVDVSVDTVAVMPVPPAFHMLSPDASGALAMHGHTDLDVHVVQVNSTASDAFEMTASEAGIGSPYMGIAGGAPGVSARSVETGVNTVRDFLGDLAAPVYGGCDETGYVTTELRPVLEPGVYCGGLTITGAEEVTFKEGNEPFVITGGPLVVDASMRDKPIKGDNVLIYLADKQAELQLHGGDFSIRAKRTGQWAGVAVMTARGANAPEKHTVENADAYFSGIFYAPESKVEFTGGRLDGVCTFLCFVSDTLKLTNSQVNYGYFMTGWSNPFGDTTVLPAEPPALKKTFRPYLLNEAPFGFY